MKIASILFLFLIVSLISCTNSQLKKHDEVSTIQEYDKCTDIPDDAENYKRKCDCINEFQLTFPMNTVVMAKIVKNASKEFGKFEKGNTFETDSSFLRKFKVLTADSSNFSWGEIGTTYTDYMIEFYDLKGNVINQAGYSCEGMLWLSPVLGTSKWGLLTSEGESELDDLMNRYTIEKKD
jgi:hypothetical protein